MSDRQAQPSRRGFLWGAAATSAAAATVVATSPRLPVAAEATLAPTPPRPDRGGGYHVSEHVKRYYKTTLV